MDDNTTVKGIPGNAGLALLTQQAGNQNAQALKNQALGDTAAQEKALKGFEALLLHEMFKSMWETVDSTGLLGENGNEAQIYRGMLNQAIADTTAEGKGIGIKKLLTKELNKHEQHQMKTDAAPADQTVRIQQPYEMLRGINNARRSDGTEG